MPVILPERHHAAWLGETDDGNLKALLLPYPADQMRMWDISPQGKQRGSLMIHRSGNPLMAEIGRLKKENDVKLEKIN